MLSILKRLTHLFLLNKYHSISLFIKLSIFVKSFVRLILMNTTANKIVGETNKTFFLCQYSIKDMVIPLFLSALYAM